MGIWDDVAFDRSRSIEAADRLRFEADHLDGLAERRAQLAAHARDGWSGQQRGRFDQRLAALQDDTAALVADLRHAATVIEHDLEEAMFEQQRRTDARDLWRREHAAERGVEGVW